MAFKDFAKVQYIKFIDSGEEVRMGGFQTAEHGFLRHLRLTIFINGAVPTTERIRTNIYGDQKFESILYQSDWANLADIPNVSDKFIGWIRTDFNFEPINKRNVYYPTIELDGYTPIPSVYEIGVAYDFPFPIYDNGEDKFYDHPLQMQLFLQSLQSVLA